MVNARFGMLTHIVILVKNTRVLLVMNLTCTRHQYQTLMLEAISVGMLCKWSMCDNKSNCGN